MTFNRAERDSNIERRVSFTKVPIKHPFFTYPRVFPLAFQFHVPMKIEVKNLKLISILW